jgi:magnesium-transporting ATPase (P-type)
VISGDNILTCINCAQEANIVDNSKPALIIDYDSSKVLRALMMHIYIFVEIVGI